MAADPPPPRAAGGEPEPSALPPGIDWNDLRAFLAVSVHGSMNRAAARLGESQPTTGRRMRRLEDAMGVALFTRGANRLELTEAGEALRACLGPMEAASREVAAVMMRFSPASDRPIRITATTTLAMFLSEHMARLQGLVAAREVVLMPGRRRLDLLRGEADIALRMNRVEPEPGLLARKLGTISFALYGRDGAETRPIIMPSGHSTMSRHRAMAREELARRPQGPLIDELPLRYQAIRAGTGIGALPCWLGDADPLLVRVSRRPDQFIHEEVFLVRAERARRDGAVETVTRELAAILRQNRARLHIRP